MVEDTGIMNYWELVEIEGKVARLTNLKYKNMKLKAYNFTPIGQALLDIGVKVLVGAVLLLLDYVTTALSNGSITLPDPAITLPVLTLVISQLDSYVIDYAKKENIPVPPVVPPQA
jgi:hypothetical protein